MTQATINSARTTEAIRSLRTANSPIYKPYRTFKALLSPFPNDLELFRDPQNFEPQWSRGDNGSNDPLIDFDRHTNMSQSSDLSTEAQPRWLSNFLAPSRQTLLVQGIKTGLAAGLCSGSPSASDSTKATGVGHQRHHRLSPTWDPPYRVARPPYRHRHRRGLGFLASPWRRHPVAFAITILVALVLCGLLNLRNSARLAGVTITIVMLVDRNGSHWTIALDRVVEVVMGILIALGSFARRLAAPRTSAPANRPQPGI